jgi:hypothetical protein
MPIFKAVKPAERQGTVMLILNAMLVMAFVFMVGMLVKDVVDARGVD